VSYLDLARAQLKADEGVIPHAYFRRDPLGSVAAFSIGQPS
jgi:hypothetical protein